MRPTPGEALASIRIVLTEEILPEVSTPYAAQVGKELISAMVKLEHWWDKVIPNLMEENDDLEALIESVVVALGKALVRRDSLVLQEVEGQVRSELEDRPGHVTKYPCYQTLAEVNRRYRALLVQVIAALEATQATHGDHTEIQSLRRQIQHHLRKYIDRELEIRDIAMTATPGE